MRCQCMRQFYEIENLGRESRGSISETSTVCYGQFLCRRGEEGGSKVRVLPCQDLRGQVVIPVQFTIHQDL